MRESSWARGLLGTLCEILEPAGLAGPSGGAWHGRTATGLAGESERAIQPVYVVPFLLEFEDVASNLFGAFELMSSTYCPIFLVTELISSSS